MPITEIDYTSDEFTASPVPAEVLNFESDVLSGNITVENTARNKKWLSGLKQIKQRESGGQNINWGGIFGGILNTVEVFAKKPQTQPQQLEKKLNYTPIIIAAVAIAALYLIKK